LVTFFIAPLMRHVRSLFLVLVAMGLVALTLILWISALDAGHFLVFASVCGVLTGVFGVILREIFCIDFPLIFRRVVYACVSFLDAWCFL
ncbi:TRIC cation channel family protein, partial [Pseudomonas syringae group genomosp. 7]|uniref:TRIC cation channel family protein n=1 Tax=Pseudomonas syringae group genomosp. 7 TaxID=251699 RepID=UPI00376F9108